jgi:hypothetical protein
MYYFPLAAGYWKLYGSALDSFWCCTGTGVEEFARTSDSIYFRDADGVYVNLFIPSEARWPAKGLRIRQETAFPSEPTTRLTITADRPVEFTLRVRVPYWATAGGSVRINGVPVPAFSTPESYLLLHRTWTTGDFVEITMPMSLHRAPMPDDVRVQAMMYGPLVLAGRLGIAGLTEAMQTSGFNAEYKGPPLPVDDIVADPEGAPWVEPVPGQALTFRATGQKRDVTLVPLNTIHGERYAVYWNVKKG